MSGVSAEIVSVQTTIGVEAEAAVLSHRDGPLLVLGAPGTGKTTLLVELVAARVGEGLDPSEVLLLAPSRRAAAVLRDRVAARVGRTIREPLARTAHSFAFGLLRRDAVIRGLPSPRLLASAEQELMIRELLAHDADAWPEQTRPALTTRFFAGQLRDLLLRGAERDLDGDDLARLGVEHDRPLWRAAGRFAREYAGVTALAHPSAYDPAELVRAAVDLLRTDPVLLAEQRRTCRLVVVDDVAEADPALLDLLDVLTGGGGVLVATADPDSTVYGFRGADPQAVSRFSTRFRTTAGDPAPQVVLRTSHRLTPQLLQLVHTVSSRIGGGRAWREVRAAGDAGGSQVQAAVLASGSDEMSHVASFLRRRHLLHGVPWSQMAVVTRSSADLAGIRRALSRHGVPVVQRVEEISLWQQAPVRAMLDLLALVSARDAATQDRVVDVLLGPLGGLDPAGLARVRRGLVAARRADGAAHRPDQVLVDVVTGRAELPSGVAAPAVSRLAATVQRGRAALACGSVEQVLWQLWDGAGVAEQWRATALSGQRDAAAADRDLDAVVALFDAAARFTDRLPGAGPEQFLDHVRAQEVPGESWTTASPTDEAVVVLTAHATKGREWDTVAVTRVQEDSWPDLRRRQSLLGVDDLVAVVDTGRLPSAAEQVSHLLAQERRLFHLAVSRARAGLLVTAIDDGELRPSRLMDDLHAREGQDWSLQQPAPALSLPVMVAELRAAVSDQRRLDNERREAARLLAVLARAGVAGAHPDEWYGLSEPTHAGPVVDQGETVRLSPSQVEGYLRCPLRWMLQRAGGDSGAALRQTIGTLVHDLAHDAVVGDWTAERIRQRYEQLWHSVDAGRGWVARRERSRVDAMVERLIGWLQDNAGSCIGAEIDVTTQVGDVTVHGRLDRLDRRPDGSVVVVDFKTSTSAPSKADVASHPQLGVYQWAVGAGGVDVDTPDGRPPRPGGGMLVHLGIPGTERAKVQQQNPLAEFDDPAWPRTLVEQVADGVRRPRLAALLNPGCGHCPVRSSCPAQPDGAQVVP